jgi:hypothetical protein
MVWNILLLTTLNEKSMYECHLTVNVKKHFYVFKQMNLYEP